MLKLGLKTKKNIAQKGKIGTKPQLAPKATFLKVIQHLHQTIGNQAVSRWIQTKLKIDQPDDKYEQEADQIAEKIMTMPSSTCTSCEEEELQPKLADKISPFIQRQEIDEEEEEEEVIQPKRNTDKETKATPEIENHISRTRGLGNPLPFAPRAFMEERFGVDFSPVRIHADSEAARMARALNAEAFTYRRDIYFGEGRYRPETTEGKKLLAHELTHVVQQGSINFKGNNFFGKSIIALQGLEPTEKEICKGELSFERRAQLLFDILQAAYTDLDAHAKKWETTAYEYGLRYKNAYDNHKNVIRKQEKHDALVHKLCFAVLTMVGVGTISVFSTWLQQGKELLEQIKINTFEDVVQVALDKALGFRVEFPSTPISVDPFKFYLGLQTNLSRLKESACSYLNRYVQWAKDVNINPDPYKYLFLEWFDPEEFDWQVTLWKGGIKLFYDPPKISWNDFEKELEIGMWAKWAASTLIKPVKKTIRRGGPAAICRTYETEEVNDPGSIVEKRLDELGITKACGVGDWGWWTTDAEVLKLVEWGRNWKPQHVFTI